ncbi:MAG: VOC family protein, partial [Bacteroidales bacterium]|nr:VOC family protein [Bacteroidales bacterium]
MESNTKSLPINGTDYVEFYVGNAKQAAHFYQSAFGFQPLAYAGFETGLKDRTSYVVKQDKIIFGLTAALTPDSPVAEHHKLHGDGIKVIALGVDNARASFETTTKKGARAYQEPYSLSDENGEVVLSGIHTYGETVHIFVERKNYQGVFLPGFPKWEPESRPEETGLMYVDHIVGNVGWNEMDTIAGFYKDVFGFEQLISFDDKDISTEYTALRSKVMASDNMWIKFPINEPAKGK